jgi:selenophosphate synthase
MKTEDPTVKVITAAQVQTDPYPIQITGPKILGWAVPVPKKAGSPAELFVAGLPSTSSVEVLVGNVACPTTASAQPDGSTKLHFTMPPQQTDSAQVAVASPGSVTAALSMPLAKT